MTDNNKNSRDLIKLIQSKNNNTIIYPFINDLVESLFKSDLNTLIENKTQLHSDKSVFMMFVNIYFMAYLHTQSLNNNTIMSDNDKKTMLKQMLSDVIHDKDKRQICVSLIKQIDPLFNIDSLQDTIKDENVSKQLN